MSEVDNPVSKDGGGMDNGSGLVLSDIKAKVQLLVMLVGGSLLVGLVSFFMNAAMLTEDPAACPACPDIPAFPEMPAPPPPAPPVSCLAPDDGDALRAAVADPPLGLPGMADKSWSQIVSLAQTQTLNFYLWSPPPSPPRRWVDSKLTPELSDAYGIAVNRIDAVYSGCATAGMALACDVADEVAAGQETDGGAVDLVWINGANFAAMKAAGTLYGPWAQLIPNAANFDFTNDAIAYDKGVSTAGLEFPFNMAQAVFIHDVAVVPTPPMTIPALKDWILANPGKFVYSDPTVDFTGAAFVRHVFYHFAGPHEDFLTGGDWEAIYTARAPAVWAALNEIEAALYQPAGEVWYPASHNADIRPLVGDGTLVIDFSMQASEATTQMAPESVNQWPLTMQAYVLDEPGTIADTNYLAIPVNAPNKEAALVAVNHIASAGSMFTRSTPETWGALQAFDPTSPSIKAWDAAFDYVNVHDATPSVEELASSRVGDLPHELVSRINADWETFVKNA